jgi:uncharacterized membrane protein
MSEPALNRLEIHLGRLLLAGVATAAALLFVGLVLSVVRVAPRAAGDLLNAGLIVLMATPILRVVVSLAEYMRMRDWFFVLITLVVLLVLCASVILALLQQ